MCIKNVANSEVRFVKKKLPDCKVLQFEDPSCKILSCHWSVIEKLFENLSNQMQGYGDWFSYLSF